MAESERTGADTPNGSSTPPRDAAADAAAAGQGRSITIASAAAVFHLGKFLEHMGEVVLMCAPPPPEPPRKVAKDRIGEQIGRLMGELETWLSRNPGHADAGRVREIINNLLAARLRLGTFQKEDEARARQDFEQALRNPAAGRITWPDTLLPGETVGLTDELTVFRVWLRLFHHKEQWETIGDAIRFELQQFKFDEAQGVISVVNLVDGTVIGVPFPVHSNKRNTPHERREIHRRLDDLNARLTRCEYPSGYDARWLSRLALPS